LIFFITLLLYHYTDKQVAYVPLDNIILDVDELQIGRVTLVKMTDTVLETVIKTLEDTIMSSSHNEEDKPLIIQNQRQFYVEHFRDKVCAKFSLVAETDIVKERAEEETRRVIDLLRYSIPFLYSNLYPTYWCPSASIRKQLKIAHAERRSNDVDTNQTHIGLGLQGEVGMSTRQIIIVQENALGFNWQDRYVGTRPFVISQQHIERMKVKQSSKAKTSSSFVTLF